MIVFECLHNVAEQYNFVTPQFILSKYEYVCVWERLILTLDERIYGLFVFCMMLFAAKMWLTLQCPAGDPQTLRRVRLQIPHIHIPQHMLHSFWLIIDITALTENTSLVLNYINPVY